MSTDEVKATFESEFAPVLGKFVILDIPTSQARKAPGEFVWKPGVYVWWDNERVIKVGRSLTNSRKRALEHVDAGMSTSDGTYSMKEMEKRETARLLLFNVKLPKNCHWVAAVEIYMENKLKPLIPSKRQG